MSDAFDGAGKPFKGASYRALLIILVAVYDGPTPMRPVTGP
jgi:hypothetical protein